MHGVHCQCAPNGATGNDVKVNEALNRRPRPAMLPDSVFSNSATPLLLLRVGKRSVSENDECPFPGNKIVPLANSTPVLSRAVTETRARLASRLAIATPVATPPVLSNGIVNPV